jgi:hypothetical protein
LPKYLFYNHGVRGPRLFHTQAIKADRSSRRRNNNDAFLSDDPLSNTHLFETLLGASKTGVFGVFKQSLAVGFAACEKRLD